MSKKLFKVKTEKIIVKGEKGRKIIGWENCMSKDECPYNYFDNVPYFYEKENKLLIYTEKSILNKRYEIQKGSKIKEEDFQKLINILNEAGNRMHEIRKKLKKLENEWPRERETIII